MRILLCREHRDGVVSAQRLAQLGHDGVLAPVLAIAALAVDLPPSRPDAVLFTSAHAPETLTEKQSRWLASYPVYAVGERTAAAARQRGFEDVRMGQGGDAASLASLIALTLPVPARLLYIAGRVRKPDLERELRGRDYGLSVVEVYDVRVAEPWGVTIRDELAAGTIDACLHYSRRSARLALDVAEQVGRAAEFARLRHLCISADVADPLLGRGLSNIAVAARPNEAGLFAAIAEPAS